MSKGYVAAPRICVALCALAVAGFCGCGKEIREADLPPDPGDSIAGEASALPAYPRFPDLLVLPADWVPAGAEYFIDSASISRPGNQTVRYTVVIRSFEGAENILNESQRCASREVMVHAFGDSRGGFREIPDPRWERIISRGVMGYRPALAERFLCDGQGWSLEPEAIRAKLRRGRMSSEEYVGN